MTIEIGGSSIGEVYFGNNSISEIYHGSDLVWSAYQPDINYLFRDIDSNGNVTLASGNLDDASQINKIGPVALCYAFFKSNITGRVDLSSVKSMGRSALFTAFQNCDGITEVDLSGITDLNGDYAMQSAFYSCRNLNTVNLSNLINITGNFSLSSTFASCSSLQNVNLSNLVSDTTSLGFSNTFQGCTSLASISLPKLEISRMYQTFRNCSSLISVNLNNLLSVPYQGFFSTFENTNLTELRLPSVKSVSTDSSTFQNMLKGVTGCVVHFPSNLQTVVSNLPWATNGFGGTNTSILFDLPSTE